MKNPKILFYLFVAEESVLLIQFPTIFYDDLSHNV